MVVSIGKWKFRVDLTQTMTYSAAEKQAHCTCGYCRNFYEAVDEIYPDLRPFLAQFGLAVEAPDELMPYDVGKDMWFDCTYAVCGEIMELGDGDVCINGLSISFDSENTYSINHSCPGPNFYLTLSDGMLPWVLEEPVEEVLSPSNEDTFLKRMTEKLLDKTSDKIIT